MKKINTKNIIYFIVILTFSLIIFIPFLTGHYASDSYNIYNVGYKRYAIEWSIKDGRLLMTVIGLIFNKINISIESYTRITLVMSIIISSITVNILKIIIEKYKKPENIKQELLILIISYITVFNFVIAISILLFLISADILVNNKMFNKKSFFISLILTALGIICYQGSICMYVTFVCLFTILKNKINTKNELIDIIKCAIITLSVAMFSVILVKVIGNVINLEQTRIGNRSISKNILIIILNLYKILQKTCDLFPHNLLLFYIISLTSLVLTYCFKLKEPKSIKIFEKLIFIIFITIISSFFVSILTTSSFFTGRMRLSIGSLTGIIMIYIYVNTNIFQKKFWINKAVIFILISFFVINIYNYEDIMINHKIVNKFEEIQCKELAEYIEKYEKKSNQKVTKLVEINISSKEYLHNLEVKPKSSFTHNALRTDWACDGVIKFYTGINLKKQNATKEQYIKYFELDNNELGYKCIDDALYVEIYYY